MRFIEIIRALDDVRENLRVDLIESVSAPPPHADHRPNAVITLTSGRKIAVTQTVARVLEMIEE